ncbi:MAG: hypothetical protein Q4F11_06340 [Eubacteriales bacterium]|nr:hypothetical protein [Eubacteriales bacterium]
MNVKKVFKWIIRGLILVLFLTWLVPFAHNSILTIMHGKEFKDEYRQCSYFQSDEKVEFYQVIEYSESRAKVYYVAERHSSANVYTFEKKDDRWLFKEFDTIWSSSGSAEDILWPYFWDVIIFRWLQ